MLSHSVDSDDRRCKPESERLEHLVRPRFTESEFAAIEAEAARRHGGKLAPLVHEATLLGLEVIHERRQALLDRLANGANPGPDEQHELEQLLAEMAESQLMDNSIDQKEQA
ncbi:hypothetical protein [Chromohalobacter sp. 296-RDG]|uniref:hypothetical protein n=1 Tax=Chromohalobacter sp. 296-RDG TaxID=2994062 RepID=UPI0024698613|nr:hypothetical protein [Chromohalobacter sp. 296-RDG]